MLPFEMSDFLNCCQNAIAKVLIAPMLCEHEREITDTQENKMNADNSKPKCDKNLHYDKDEQLCFLMAKCYQYMLLQHCVRYHCNTFAENKTSLFEV